MTGAEFKGAFLLFSLSVVLPAVLLIMVRAGLKEGDEEFFPHAWWAGFVKLTLCVLGLFFSFLYKCWSDEKDVEWIFGLSSLFTYFATWHVVAVLFLAKLGQLVVKPAQPHIPFSLYCLLFVGAFFFQGYLVKLDMSPVDGSRVTEYTPIGHSTVREPAAKPTDAIDRSDNLTARPAAPTRAPSGPRVNWRPPTYDKAVSIIEQEFPQLNPDSSLYNAALVEKIQRRIKFYEERQYERIRALVFAVQDVMEVSESTDGSTRKPQNVPFIERATSAMGQVSSTAIENPKTCEFKPVMTNLDYLACGIQPPQ